MVDISAIAGTVSALKGAVDITKAMITLHDAQAVHVKVIELNAKILEAQSSAFAANDERSALIERVRTLEKEIADMEAWEAKKHKYELKEIAADAFAYVVKEAMRGAEPPHFICANCYEHRKTPILQRLDNGHLFCPECKTKVRYGSAESASFSRRLNYNPRG